MDNFRLILIFSLAMLGLFIYQAWLQDYPPQQPVTPTAAVADSPPTTVVESAAPAGVPDVFVSPNDAQLAPTPAIAAATLTGGAVYNADCCGDRSHASGDLSARRYDLQSLA